MTPYELGRHAALEKYGTDKTAFIGAIAGAARGLFGAGKGLLGAARGAHKAMTGGTNLFGKGVQQTAQQAANPGFMQAFRSGGGMKGLGSEMAQGIKSQVSGGMQPIRAAYQSQGMMGAAKAGMKSPLGKEMMVGGGIGAAMGAIGSEDGNRLSGAAKGILPGMAGGALFKGFGTAAKAFRGTKPMQSFLGSGPQSFRGAQGMKGKAAWLGTHPMTVGMAGMGFAPQGAGGGAGTGGAVGATAPFMNNIPPGM